MPIAAWVLGLLPEKVAIKDVVTAFSVANVYGMGAGADKIPFASIDKLLPTLKPPITDTDAVSNV